MKKSDRSLPKLLLRPLAITLSVAMVCWALRVLNFLTDGGIRSTAARFNITAAGIGDFWVPCLVLGILLVAPFSRAKWWSIAGLVLLTAFSFFCFYWVRVWPITDPPQCVQTISAGRFPVRVFRWPGWNDGPVIIQQEFPLLPGLVWVRPLASQEAEEFRVNRTDDHHLTIQFSGAGNKARTESSTSTVYLY